MIFVVDFDGTIIFEDTVDLLLEKYADAKWRVLEGQWVRGEISTQECLKEQIKLLKMDQTDLDQLIEGLTIDPYFKDFLAASRGDVIIASDGIEYVIQKVLEKHQIRGIPIYANRLHLGPRGASLSFGVGKTHLAHQYGRPLILIGDGQSDLPLAEKADYVIAKATLKRLCIEKKISHFPFETFKDVLEICQKEDFQILYPA